MCNRRPHASSRINVKVAVPSLGTVIGEWGNVATQPQRLQSAALMRPKRLGHAEKQWREYLPSINPNIAARDVFFFVRTVNLCRRILELLKLEYGGVFVACGNA